MTSQFDFTTSNDESIFDRFKRLQLMQTELKAVKRDKRNNDAERIIKSLSAFDILKAFDYQKPQPEKASGEEFLCSSPFTRDSNPSFFFNEQKKVFKDFSQGGAGGDYFDLVALFMNATNPNNPLKKLDPKRFPEILKKAAEIAGVEGPSSIIEKSEPRSVAEFCRQFIKWNPEKPFVYYNEAPYRFNGEVYELCDPSTVYRILMDFAVEASEDPSPQYFQTAMKHLSLVLGHSGLSNPFWINTLKSAKDVINLKNGILNLKDYLAGNVLSLQKHTANLFSTVQLQFDYDPYAECPLWQAFLDRVLPEEDAQQLLEEFMGLCLTHDASLNKAFFMVGRGANGKSVIIRVLQAMLGEGNYATLSFDHLSPAHASMLEQLDGFTANIQEDAAEMEKSVEGMLKNVLSGGAVTVNPKYRKPYVLHPTAKWITATNQIPQFKDRTDGMLRRIIIMPFRHQIPPEEQNPGMITAEFWQASGELPGIFNRLLKGLKRLYSRSPMQFIEPEMCRQAKEEFVEETQPIRLFVKECLEVSPTGWVETDELYDHFNTFMEKNGFKGQFKKPNFMREINALLPQIQPSRIRSGQNRVRGYKGINLIRDQSYTQTIQDYNNLD